MPPSPEAPGSLQSDIYGLGMVLYVISSGSDPHYFPEVSFKPPEPTEAAAFGQMKAVILKACHPDRDHRFASAKDIAESLRLVQSLIEPPSRTRALGPVLES